MFGPDAIQHAMPDSYVDYFERMVRRALLSEEGRENPFLQHLFLGDCLDTQKPEYWHSKTALNIELIHGGLLDVLHLNTADVVSLSNIFDWSHNTLISAWVGALQVIKPGSLVLLRQLNNNMDLRNFFNSGFKAIHPLEYFGTKQSKALFYNQYRVFERL